MITSVDERREIAATAVAAVLRGEREAFATLVEAYSRQVLSFLATRAPDPAQAEDLAQTVFVAAYESLARYDPQRDFGAWLFGIARNQLGKAWERAGREQRHLAAYGEQTRAAMSRWATGEADTIDRLDALDHCLELLPPRWRELVDFHYEQEWRFTRIAQARGTAASTIRATMHRVRARLRDCIEQRIAPPGSSS